jgi:hypothetical protein
LGERGALGVEPAALFEEWLHVPLVVHRPACREEPCRSSQLTSPVNLHAMLSHWSAGSLELPVFGKPTAAAAASGDPARWLLFANERGDRALRTPGWYLIRPSAAATQPEGEGQDVSPLLYLKPDDRWEFNEVCDRRPEIAAELSGRLDELLTQAAAGGPLVLLPLPPELVKGG